MRRWRALTTAALVLMSIVCLPVHSRQASGADPRIAQGQAAFEGGRYARALALWKPALERARSGADEALVGSLDFKIGLADYDLSNLDAAVADFRAALSIERALKNRLREAKVLRNVGNAEYGLGRYDEALNSYQQALKIHRALADRLEEANDIGNIGIVEMDAGRYDDALRAYQRSLAVHRELKSRLGEAGDLGNIGIVEYHLGRYGEALRSQQQALTVDRQIGNRLGAASDLANIGIVEEGLGRYDDALRSQQRALTVHRALENRLGEASDLGNIGIVEYRLGRYDDALRSQQQALIIDRQIGNRLGAASDLGNIGIVEMDAGRDEDALSSYRAALAAHRELGNRLGEAGALGNIGNVENRLGRYDDALSSQQQALTIDRQIGNRLGEASDAGNLGLVQEELGRYDDALSSQQQALSIDRQIENRLGEAGALGNIGLVEMYLGRYDEALSSQRQALAIHRELGNRPGEADDLGNIGNVEQSLGRYDEALRSQQQALTAHRELGNRLGEADDLGNVGALEEVLGRYDDALNAARQAADLDKELLSPEGSWRALHAAAAAEAHLDRREAALADYDAALEQIESLRAGLERTERSGFFSNKLFVYDEYVAYLLDLDRRFPGQGYDRKALEIFERKSARAVLEQVGQSAAQHFRGVPADVVAAEREADGAAERAQAALSKLLSATQADQIAIASAEQDLAAAKARAATLEASIKAQYPAYYELRHPQPLLARCGQAQCATIAAFQQTVLRPGELLLVYDLLQGQSVLWLIDRDRVQPVPLAPSAGIDKAVARLGTHVAGMLVPGVSAARRERSAAADLPAFAADSYALYRLLVPEAAAAALGRAKSLIVVPSGSLYRLAFETLVSKDPASTAQPHYLIEDLPVSYVPSASLLAVVRTSYARPSAGRNPLLAFANPTFGAAEPGQARGLSSYAGLQLAAVRSAFRSDSGAAPLGETVFPALPGTQVEADAVRAALGAPGASLLWGEAATRQRVLELNASDALRTYQYVLFATHAVLPSEIEGLTQPAIVLAHPERGDGLLTMADVFGLSLDADFVTLSACSTGVAAGDTSGEGISGLTRAFLYAGTPALSVTLWEVDDAAAPQITPPFFAAMHAGKLSAAQALRRAKLAMIASSQARFRHPYAWGPSVIFGDGDRPEEKR